MKRSALVLLASAVLTAAVPASAGPTVMRSWDFNCTSGCPGLLSTKEFGSVQTSTHKVKVTAWSSTLNSTSLGANTRLDDEQFGSYSGGLGVTYTDEDSGGSESGSPQHSMDNDRRYDLLMFDFGEGNSFSLEQVTIGWWSNSSGSHSNSNPADSDITVLAYIGGGMNNPSLMGRNYSTVSQDLTAYGWKHIGNYDADYGKNVAPTTGDLVQTIQPLSPPANASNVSSRYWIVGAYNPVYSGSAFTDCATDLVPPLYADMNGYDDTDGGINPETNSESTCGRGSKDYVKVAGISGRRVPAPAIGGMLVLLVPLLYWRRRVFAKC